MQKIALYRRLLLKNSLKKNNFGVLATGFMKSIKGCKFNPQLFSRRFPQNPAVFETTTVIVLNIPPSFRSRDAILSAKATPDINRVN
jgi:hypothetical protein